MEIFINCHYCYRFFEARSGIIRNTRDFSSNSRLISLL